MIKNCFNYVGSKDRIYSFIHENLDKSRLYLADIFCGSGVVGVNEVNNYDKILLNDACWQVAKTLEYFEKVSPNIVLNEIENCINKFQLSKTNKEGYLNLRSYYNANSNLEENFDPILFYCLVTHSFNYNIHINSSGGFNVTFGANRSYFNDSLKGKLTVFQKSLYNNKSKIYITSYDYSSIINQVRNYKLLRNTIFYCDPPYLISDSSYGRIYYLGKWSTTKEEELYRQLDSIHNEGGSFLLSNVLENNGKKNDILKEWSKKYHVIEVPSNFYSCNYQRKNSGKTVEVLVRNYEC